MFVAIEGVEGSGKSTLLSGLAGALRERSGGVVETREPGGTETGEEIRQILLRAGAPLEPLTEALLVNAARAQHVREVIRPALDAGRIVLCDRFVDSTLAYQGYGRGLDLEPLRALCGIASGGLDPDIVFLIDVPVSVARARLRERSREADRIEAEGDEFHERVRRGFLALADSPRHRVLDGTLAPEALLERSLVEFSDALRIGVS